MIELRNGYISYFHQKILTFENVKQIFKNSLSEPAVLPFMIRQFPFKLWSQAALGQI